MLDQSKDLQLCFQKYSDLASKGDRYAMMYVADCYLYGWGVDRDFNQYKNLLNQAASMGVVDACERLFYEALANQNYDEINRVFTIWSKREPDEPNDKYSNTYNRTVELYNSLGKKNIPNMFAAFETTKFPSDWDKEKALCYQFGYGVEKNSLKAAEIIKNHLGELYDDANQIAIVLGLYDVGEISREQMGETLFNKMCEVGVLDIDYAGSEQGYNQRLMIFAACAGNLSSQIEMGNLYLGYDMGMISPNEYSNDAEAVNWFVTALNNGGDTDAAAPLLLLCDQLGQLDDYDNAFKGFYVLANHGWVPAMRILGSYYYNGWGVQKDITQAGQWWLRAAQNDDEAAINIVNKVIETGNGDYWTGINALIAEETQQSNQQNSGVNNNNQNFSGQSQSTGGCYVATCVYGSYDCPEVWTLRRYRDYDLSQTWHGRLFIKAYYAISPTIVRVFGKNEIIRKIWKMPIDRLVKSLREKGYESTEYNDRDWS